MLEIAALAKDLSFRLRGEARLDVNDVVVSIDGDEFRLGRDRTGDRWVIWASLDIIEDEDRLAAAKASLDVNDLHAFSTGITAGLPSDGKEAFVGRNFAPKVEEASAFCIEIEQFLQMFPAIRGTFREALARYVVKRETRPGLNDDPNLIVFD